VDVERYCLGQWKIWLEIFVLCAADFLSIISAVSRKSLSFWAPLACFIVALICDKDEKLGRNPGGFWR